MGRVSKNNIVSKYKGEFTNHFTDANSFSMAIAPGRINIIGEHTDYNLGLAMPIAIDRWICAITSIREDRKINVYSSDFDEDFLLDIDSAYNGDKSWKKYIYGCVKIFIEEYNINKGINLLVGGNIPIGFGMSSSAALEVSILASLFKIFNFPIDNYKILELSRRVEKDFLGIQSGLLDQYASVFSLKETPLLIDFKTLSHVYVDSNIDKASWVLINSMIDRELSDSKYNERVGECQLALNEINILLKTKLEINEVDFYHLGELRKSDNAILYNRMYHVLSENKRVKSMKEALEKGDLNLVGEILNQSHNSLSKNYDVSCKEIDYIIAISRMQNGFYGGRIMGGGFGGCCICLIERQQKDLFIKDVKKAFYDNFKYEIKIESVDFSDGLEVL